MADDPRPGFNALRDKMLNHVTLHRDAKPEDLAHGLANCAFEALYRAASGDERAAFEAWFTRTGDYEPEQLSGRDCGTFFLYFNADTGNLWEAFQAGSAALDAPKAEAWIDVNDRLPTEIGLYFVYCPQSYHKFTTAEWGPVGQRLGDERYGWVREFKRRSDIKPKTWITHWMPIHAPTSPAPQEESHD